MSGLLQALPRVLMMPRGQTGRLRTVLVTVAVATVVAGGASLVPNIVVPPSGGGTGANLWVDTNGGTCSRSGGLVAYVDTAACASFQEAYAAAASSGDIVCVKPGSYPVQNITFVTGKTTPNTVIQGGCGGEAEPSVLAVHIGNGGTGNQPRALTFKDMAITGNSSTKPVTSQYGGTGIANSPTDITFDNVDIAVGQAGPGQAVEILGATLRLTIKNSTIGPFCCGQDVDGGSPVGIRLGTWDRPGFAHSTDTVIDHNVIQGVTRLCSEWLNGFGACPSTTCPNVNGLCHEDAIQIYGSDNLTITNNRIYHTGINGIFLDSTDPETNGLIANNMIGDIMRGATCFDIDGRNIHGTWNIINNTCSIAGTDGYDITWASAMQTNGAIWNWKGNVGAVSVHADFGTATCTGGTTGVFTFSYNTLSTNNIGQIGCGGNETVGDPSYVNTALDPANTMDLHLFGAETSPADNKIPPGTCFIATDIDGDARPLPPDTNCDAGADER